jgi:Mlc titration factor MtfA (ptsG expression regulator)
MFDWLRKRRPARAIPDGLWQDLLIRYPFLASRPAAELPRLRELAAQFLASKEFHGANGLVITGCRGSAIAAQAVLPVLNLGLAWYDDFVGIVVHPGEVLARRTVTDDHGVVHHYHEVLAGEAMEGGPVMLSWNDVDSAGNTAEQGYNVVIHEFIHKIDMRDGAPDGCPPLATRAARQAWLDVMRARHQAFGKYHRRAFRRANLAGPAARLRSAILRRGLRPTSSTGSGSRPVQALPLLDRFFSPSGAAALRTPCSRLAAPASYAPPVRAVSSPRLGGDGSLRRVRSCSCGAPGARCSAVWRFGCDCRSNARRHRPGAHQCCPSCCAPPALQPCPVRCVGT